MNSSYKKIIPALLIAAIAITSCKEKKENTAETVPVAENKDTASAIKQIAFTADQYKLSEIETGTIELRNLSNIIKLTGAIEAEPGSVATVSAPL